MPSPERSILVAPGETVRLIVGGSVIDIKNNPTPNTPYSLETKTLNPREEEREQLKAKFPQILFPFALADLNRLSYKALGGGEEIGSQMTFDETEANMRKWIEEARRSGFSDKDIGELSDSLLREYQLNPNLIKGIGVRVKNLVKEIWSVKKRSEKSKG